MSASRPQAPVNPAGLLLLIAALVLLALFLYHALAVLALLFVSVLFALYLSGLTTFLTRKLSIGRGAGVLAALMMTASGFAAIGWLIVPPLLQETGDLLRTLPQTVGRLSAALIDLGAQYPILRGVLPDVAAIEVQLASMQSNAGERLAGLIPYLFSGVGAVIHLVSVVVMSIYLALRPEVYVNGFVRLIPIARRPLVTSILKELTSTLRGWIGAQLVAMVILAGLTWVGLLVLEVPFALAFGVFTGVAVVVPFFGTLVSTVLPALFVMGAGGAIKATLVLLLGVVVHLVEANFVHPMIMERRINIPPVLSIVSVLVMAELFGGLGLLLAVPLLATVMVIVRRIYVEEFLERKSRRQPKISAHPNNPPEREIVLQAS